MSIFDIFGRKRREQERLEKERLQCEAEAHRKAEEQRRADAQRRANEERRKREEAASKASTIEPFVFNSTSHQRYQGGNPVMGLQQCGRTVRVEKNTSGCPGYRLQPGKGYIVKVFNDDLNKPNMSDKPMIVVKKTPEMVELRGFPIEAQTPFGWQEVDYSVYGFKIYYEKGKVVKCVLHMYDRNTWIEYRIGDAPQMQSTSSQTRSSMPVSETERFAKEGMSNLSRGEQGDTVYHPLYKSWKSIQQNPEVLKKVSDKALIGNALLTFISFGTVQDIDDRQQILSLAYLMISEAIKDNPYDVNLVKNRLIIQLIDREALQYTVSSVVNTDSGFDFMGLNQFHSRDALLKMIYADIVRFPALRNISMFQSAYNDICQKISTGFFGKDETPATVLSEGNNLHSQVTAFLVKKAFEEEDVDF